MEKKREEKNKVLQEELNELELLEGLDAASLKEEVLHRNFKSVDEFNKRIATLRIKLTNKRENHESSETIDESKYPLLQIEDYKLTQEQIKQKRIQKMQRTAAVMRLEKRQA